MLRLSFKACSIFPLHVKWAIFLDSGRIDAATKQLQDEQRRLARLRSDYETITRSRFHALRMFWFSLKGVFGLGKDDRFAVWSPGVTPSFGSRNGPSHAPTRTPQERHLFHSWADHATLSADPPTVSVVIPVYNHCDVTVRCLQSLSDMWPATLAIQVIVVDDASTDQTPSIFTELTGVDYVRNAQNQGFVRSCNRGAALARGKYICFLNNDTEVREAWLDHLVTLAESDPLIGAVGSKLIYPDGTLQEAGGIIFRDASGWNYGRTADPNDPRYNYPRDVDYCSGAALMVRRDLFLEIGGFCELFAPAYYEDVDLCFSIRSLGYRVVYQPLSEVVHYEGLSSGTDIASGSKRFQEINRPKFHEKWFRVLEGHYAPHPSSVPGAARRLKNGPTILIVDSYVPLYDRDAGSLRLMQIIRLLCEANFQVIFLPDNYAPMQPYTAELHQLGVEVLHHVEQGRSQIQSLEEILPFLDFAWICRPELFHKYESMIRRNGATKVLYDTIDLHFVRKRREYELFGGNAEDWQASEREELSAARKADATIVVTEDERRVLNQLGIDPVHVIPTLHDAVVISNRRSCGERSGLLFIGGYNHTPNVDAAKWLCSEIMPLVWQEEPTMSLTLLGSNPPESILALQSNLVRVPGYVPDVGSYFETAKLFVAPIRFGAGIKGKVGHALSYGLPVVLTSIAAEGFGFTDNLDCLVADDAPSFAAAIIQAYRDEALWNTLSAGSMRILAPFTADAIQPRLIGMLSQIAEMSAPARV